MIEEDTSPWPLSLASIYADAHTQTTKEVSQNLTSIERIVHSIYVQCYFLGFYLNVHSSQNTQAMLHAFHISQLW